MLKAIDTSSIVEKLETLVTIKEEIGVAIANKGVEVNTIEFDKYASLIDSIQQKDPQTEQELVETKKELADTKSELAELKALMERVKEDLKTIIENYGGTVADDMPIEGYPSIVERVMESLGDYEGKAYLLEVIYAKNPDFEQLVNMDSSLTDIANIVLAIGPMNFTFKAKVNPITVTKPFTANKTDLTTIIEENLVNYLENPKAIPLREVITNVSVSPLNNKVNINIGG